MTAATASLTERKLAALDLVRERVTDEDRVVLAPRHMFETEDGRRLSWVDVSSTEPCRACLAGWATYAERHFGFDDDSVSLTLEKACELLDVPEGVDGCRVTGAVSQGSATLNEVIDRARGLVLEQERDAKRARARDGIDVLGRLGILGGLGT